MKVLHICTEDTKGAGLCAYRIHKSLQKLGIESKMLVLNKAHVNDNSIYAPYRAQHLLYRIFHKILRSFCIYLFEYDKVIQQAKEKHSLYSTPIGFVDITNNKLVEEADVIHLHFIDFFFNQPKFFQKVRKPIVWTLHDEGLFYGTSHYQDSVLKDDELEKKYYIVKRNMVANAYNLGIVFLSQYFYKKFENETMIHNCKKTIINNSVDCSNFVQVDKKQARAIYGIGENDIVFVTISVDISDPRKGLNKLIQAIESFNNSNMTILAIGDDTTFEGHPLVKTVGKVYNPLKLSELLSCSDYFVLPSLQEAFSQAPLEAMACGKPVIITPVSGTEEMIREENGIICKGFEIIDIIEGIELALSRSYDEKTIRNYVLKNFSPEVIANSYIQFYKDMISKC